MHAIHRKQAWARASMGKSTSRFNFVNSQTRHQGSMINEIEHLLILSNLSISYPFIVLINFNANAEFCNRKKLKRDKEKDFLD